MMNPILILDFGGQYNQLIAKQIRNLGFYCELVPYSISILDIAAKNPKGIIFTGGPNSVYSKDSPNIDKEIFNLNIPILGICYGAQLICHTLGSIVEKSQTPEYGTSSIELNSDSILFKKIKGKNSCLMSHTDSIKTIPEGFKKIASTSTCEFAAIGNDDKKIYGVQFHPEVELTPFGQNMLMNFIKDICNISPNWNPDDFVKSKISEIKEIAKDKKVICALSGGVDSSVAATLVHKAIGDNLICIFVDHGLLRKGEGDAVEETFKNKFNMNLIRINAEDRFLSKLKGVTDPEKKRKIIGEEFIRIFEEEALKLGDISFLVQGTIYADVIESGTKTSATIKSHHNVGGLPEKMNLKLIEPLRELFKDEVRQVGLKLSLPKELVFRQPFPGPGMAIRVLGEVTKEKLHITREADAIFREEIAKSNLDKEIWQYFACLPNIRSVGVMGDERTYCHTIALRAVYSSDGMTSEWAKIPYDVLENISKRIVNEVKSVNRIVYDITSKPPATIEWE